MFCPKCATQNLEGASFCRVCGANISLVPQAVSGQLPVQNNEPPPDARARRRHGREPSLDNAFRSAFMGLGFLFVSIALAFSRMGTGWWFWLLIPAFSMMGTGVAAGTTMPCQVMASHPRNPVSATVGNSGSEGDRCPEVTAKAAESLA